MTLSDIGRKTWRLAAALAMAVLPLLPATAQEYPARPISVVVGYAPGTGADVLARYFTEKLRVLVGTQPVVVENKAGALTNIAAEYVARAKPDGYTVFITAGNSTFSANPYLFKNITFDPLKDYSPVTTLARLPFLFTVAPTSPLKTVQELTAHLKTKGSKASYAYPNSFSQAATELYKKITGVEAVAVAYKATPPAMLDMIKGDIDFIIMDATFGVQQEKQGQIKVLGVTTAERSPVAPTFPSAKESGLADYDLSAWWAVWLPANAPAPVVNKLQGWFNQIVATDETKAFLLTIGAAPLLGDAQLVAKMLPEEMKKWEKIIREAKIEAQ
jgi:tripartite-type tricarboxylate transporter receptor subunit TctC